jgi:hypothetical protein
MKTLGTILPNKQSIKTNEDFYRANEKAKAAAAKSLNLTSLKKVIVGGEIRYYAKEDLYAVVSSRTMTAKWFKVTADGDFATIPQ